MRRRIYISRSAAEELSDLPRRAKDKALWALDQLESGEFPPDTYRSHGPAGSGAKLWITTLGRRDRLVFNLDTSAEGPVVRVLGVIRVDDKGVERRLMALSGRLDDIP